MSLAWALATLALSSPALPREYLCFRATGEIRIDGRLDDPAWATAPWTEDFVDIEGDEHPRPRFRTRAKMLWDDRFLFIGAELEEPHVWATLTRRDSVIFQDNDFEVFLDPDGDTHQYYELEMNALNTLWDLMLIKPYRDGGPAVFHWDYRRIRTAVNVRGTLNDPKDEDRGWTIEIAIPWNDLFEHQSQIPQDDSPPPTPWRPSEGTTWRLNFSRVEWDVEVANGSYRKVQGRPEHNWVWSPQGAIDMHRPEQWGYLQFTEKPPADARFVPDPAKPARQALHRFYYAARAYRERHGSWPRTWKEAGLTDPPPAEVLSFRVHTTPSLYEARATVRYPDGTTHVWVLLNDSKILEVKK